MRRISRSAFIMTYNREMLSIFKKKYIEVPFFSNHTLIYNSPLVEIGYKIIKQEHVKKL